jgi:hypothetical protein
MSEQTAITATGNQPPRKGRLWLWFTIGFGIVFLVMALVWPMHFYDGRSVRQTWLWQYYLLEIQLALNSSGKFGPTSGNATAAFRVLATHVVIAMVGGVVSAGIGWATRKKSPAA